MPTLRILTLLPLVVMDPSNAADSQATSPRGHWKPEVEAAIKRESPNLPTVPMTSKDGKIRLTVISNGKPTIERAEDKSYQLTIPIGADEPVNCYVVPVDLDVATTLSKLTSFLTKFEEREVLHFGAGIVARFPFLSTETAYLVDESGKKGVGFFKAYAVKQKGQGFYCALNSPGYASTLRRLVEQIAASLALSQLQDIQQIYRDVALYSFNNQTFGFEETVVYAREGGGFFYAYSAATIKPLSTKELGFYSRDFGDLTSAKGKLLYATHRSTQLEESEYDIQLKQSGDSKYLVSGTLKGKAVSGTIARPIPSNLARIKQVYTQLVAGAGEETVTLQYLPTVDPLDVTKVVYRRMSSPPVDLPFEVQTPEGKYRAALDKQGMVFKRAYKVGANEVTAKRVLEEGRLPGVSQ